MSWRHPHLGRLVLCIHKDALYRKPGAVIRYLGTTNTMDSQTHGQGRGRPSKYNEKFPEQLLAYFNEYLQNPSTQQITERTVKYFPDGREKERFEKFKTASRGVPTIFGFALKNKISYMTLTRWAREKVGTAPDKGEPDKRPFKYPDFCYAYKLVEHFQKEFMLQAGMSGSAPAMFVMFAAKNMIGWRDATEQRIVDKDGKDRAMPSYVILPARKTEAEAEEDFTDQEEGDSAPAKK